MALKGSAHSPPNTIHIMNTTKTPHCPTSPSLLAGLPATCPECGSHSVAWSPLRVWCTRCEFQTAAQRHENVPQLIARWNAAVRDGEGYCELLEENIARRERERRERENNSSAELDENDSALRAMRALFATPATA